MKLTGISYNPKTGVMCRHGKPCMSPNKRGWKKIQINGKTMLQHRVAWFLVYGFWPKEIDHINQDKADNRLINLRACTRSINSLNRGPRSDNKTGHQGVSWIPERKKYRAWYRNKHLGLFKTLEEAVARRREAEELHA